jgi:hypothetical protein
MGGFRAGADDRIRSRAGSQRAIGLATLRSSRSGSASGTARDRIRRGRSGLLRYASRRWYRVDAALAIEVPRDDRSGRAGAPRSGRLAGRRSGAGRKSGHAYSATKSVGSPLAQADLLLLLPPATRPPTPDRHAVAWGNNRGRLCATAPHAVPAGRQLGCVPTSPVREAASIFSYAGGGSVRGA